MFARRFGSMIRVAHLFATVIFVFTLPAVLSAQTATSASSTGVASTVSKSGEQPIDFKDYAKPHPSFPQVWLPYEPRQVPEPSLINTPRMDSLMREGKLYLSIDDAVALTLENNLDIYIARYNLNIAATDVLRARSGANILGVNAGVVQNTPGGGVGGLGGTVGSGTGGTTVAPSGLASGTNGLVSSTLGIGAPITGFDPILSGTLQLDKNDSESVSVFSPVPVVAQNTYTSNLSYLQGFHWGGALSVGFNNTHVTTNNPTSLLTPELSSNFQARFTQNLLQGFGFVPTTRFIIIAKNNQEITDIAFRLQVITTVDQIENMYWDLVYAYENVRVQQESLTYAQKAFEDAQRQAKVGTAPPIQVVSAQSTVATDQQNLILAQNNLQLQQLLMKNALSRSIDDPVFAEADVIPTSTMRLPKQEPVTPIQEMIDDALRHRAELVESRIDLNSRQVSDKAIRNALLPTLQAYAYYGGSGVGGDVNPAVPNCATTTSTFCYNQKTAPPPFQTSSSVGYGTTLNQLITSTAPDKGIGLTLSIPIRNRQGQADQVRSQLEMRQAEVRLHQLENQVRIEVRNAQFDVKQNRASVEAAQSAVDLARQTLNADQQKLRVGLTTSTVILQDAATLTTTESNLVSAKAAYEKSRIELERATGLLLEDNGINIDDAERGQVTRQPTVPYVEPRTEIQPAQEPLSAPQQPTTVQPPPGGQM